MLQSESICPCGSNRIYQKCCEPYHRNKKYAPTAKALMRSRYSAYALREIDYLGATTYGDAKKAFDHEQVKRWAEESTFTQLRILSAKQGKRHDAIGWVKFAVDFNDARGAHTLHELSEFHKISGR